jgi:hypothetical protein
MKSWNFMGKGCINRLLNNSYSNFMLKNVKTENTIATYFLLLLKDVQQRGYLFFEIITILIFFRNFGCYELIKAPNNIIKKGNWRQIIF